MPLASDLTEFSTQGPALVNFDFTDIASGTGYEDYFLIESQDSGGKDYHLTSNPDFSNSAFIEQAGSAGTKDLDYDLTPFVIPRTVNGTVLISVPVVSLGGASSPAWTAELYRFDGTNEFQIGSTVTLTTSIPEAGQMLYFRMDVDNELIPVGETLRLRFVMQTFGSTTVKYGIDPANRTDVNLVITTTSKISVPYKLDS